VGPLDLTLLRLEQIAGFMQESEANSRAEQALLRLENALQQVFGTYPYLRAPAPPEHLEHNPRGEKEQP
jgi:hypothetical protein